MTLTFNHTGVTVIDERTPVQGNVVTNSYGPAKDKTIEIGLHPGVHRIRTKLEGYPEVVWELEGAPGSKVSHAFVIEKAKAPPPVGPVGPRPRPVPTSVYVTGGVTLAVAAGGAVVGILALGKHNEYTNDGSDPTKAQAVRPTASG